MRPFMVDDPTTTLDRLTDRPASVSPNSAGGQVRGLTEHGLATVLLVDDDVFILETLAELLELEDYRVLQAVDADSALQHLHGGEIDILITDLSMPGSDGIALIKQGRSTRRDLPAILLTGYAEDASLVGGSADTPFVIMRKPVESNLLVERIRSLVSLRPVPAGLD